LNDDLVIAIMSSEEMDDTAVVTAVIVEDATDIHQLVSSIEESPKQPEKDHQSTLEPGELKKLEQSNTETPNSLVKRPPKMRLKLSMRKLPIQANRKPTTGSNAPTPDQNNSDDGEDDDNDEVRATVVDSDDDGEDHAIAAVLGDEFSSQGEHGGSTTTLNKPKRRSLSNPSRQIRLPPIASPGLYMAPPSGTPKEIIAKNGLVAPAAIFDHHMESAGYTKENRTKRPHRGSSTKRTIGDMFDSNLALSLRFPPLIPPVNELIRGSDDMDIDEGSQTKDIRQLLVDSLARKPNQQAPETIGSGNSRKRHKPLRMADMVPVSLILSLPEEYIDKQIKYVGDVNRREKAIIEYQDAVFMALSSRSDDGSDDNNGSKPADTSFPKVPAIPDPPNPPKLNELGGLAVELYHDDGNGHICLPKGKEDFVAHLDPNCFHITEGRYFGLATNLVADPTFVGPNAPGIAGMNASGSSGLATSSSGGGISGAMALTLSTTYNGTTAGSAAAFRVAGTVPAFVQQSTNSGTKTPPSSATADLDTVTMTLPQNESSTAKPPLVEELTSIGPRPTATYTDLKKIFDINGSMAQTVKDCIIKAAVHASRSGHHCVSWLAPDGETYPDVSKAFATYAGLKPCRRCKSNKQGAYHCRLRRKHKDLDYDGGDSSTILSSLLVAPMETLLLVKLS
jgi:hypothetical protein